MAPQTIMTKINERGVERFWTGFWPSLAVLLVILSFLFRESFKPGIAHFSNDGPLGVLKSEALQVPAALTGYWADLNWIGFSGATAPLSVTYILLWLFGPVGFAKFYPPVTLLILGAGAWVFFRTLKLSPGLCGVASLAAALNMNFFSNTCWGLGTRSLTLASAFLALAALNTRRAGSTWINFVLAGLCVGMAVIEGADNGAIFSLFIAAYVVFRSFAEGSTLPRKLAGFLRLGVVALFAALIAAQVLITLTGIAARTARKGAAPVAAALPTAEEREAEEQRRWVFATQWSLAPAELLRVIIPGLFGYRMDTEGGGEYWGRVGEYWAVPDGPQRRSTRSSGAGEYAGVLVVLVGVWALFYAWRERGGPRPTYDVSERRHIFFWAAMLVPAVLFAVGHHAPFYKLVYALPYFSTIRNPMKFMHPGHMILLILFGYGLLGMYRRYLDVALVSAASFSERFKNWSARALPVEKWWLRGAVVASVLGFVTFLACSSARAGLSRHLQEIGFPDPRRAEAIANFSVNEVGKFTLFLAGSVALVSMIQLGMFAGKRARWGALLLGALVTIDLARANLPWIKHYDYREQYASNPIIEILRKEPWLHRVAVFPAGMVQQQQAAQQITIANQVWRGPWLQWLCQYYNIQSLDMPQDPRPAPEKTNYLAHVSRNTARLWELTNTRYVLGLAGPFADVLNQSLDPARRGFRVHTAFAFKQNPESNIGAETNAAGPWALLEFIGALPRARLYTNWQITTNEDATLNTLADHAFDPHQVVLVNDPVPPPTSTNAALGTVEFASYAPKRVELKVDATAPSILLLNDAYDRDWRVSVSGRPEQLLRCNHLMRGVQVPVGTSTVLFEFRPSLAGMKITLLSITLGILLCGYLAATRKSRPSAGAVTAPPDTTPSQRGGDDKRKGDAPGPKIANRKSQIGN
jgi:branched-subunit amino acid transport protein